MANLLLADQAFQAFRALLFAGEVRAGQLVSMAELVERTGFQMAPVREAVKRAEAIGLVQIRPKRGVLVLEAVPDNILACFRLRCVLDQEGARLLAEGATPAALAALRREHEAVRAEASKDMTLELQHWAKEVDWKLHQMLADALDNDLAADLYRNNRDRIAVLQQSRRFLPERIIPAMDEHLRIIALVTDGQATKAMEAVRQHLAGTLRWWGVGLASAASGQGKGTRPEPTPGLRRV